MEREETIKVRKDGAGVNKTAVQRPVHTHTHVDETTEECVETGKKTTIGVRTWSLMNPEGWTASRAAGTAHHIQGNLLSSPSRAHVHVAFS